VENIVTNHNNSAQQHLGRAEQTPR